MEAGAGDALVCNANPNGGVGRYYAGLNKLVTTYTGIDVTGSVTCDVFTSTGIDDNATSTAITIDASENVTLANSAILKVKDAFGDTAMQFNVLSSGSNSGRISVDPDNTGASSQLSVYVDASEKLTVLSTGDVNVKTGNLVIGTSGKGIDFSATSDGSGTMTSEVLDDYEEGTWTAKLSDGTTEVELATSSTYTKIGRLVTITVSAYNVDISSLNGTAQLRLSNIPYNSISDVSDIMYITGTISAENIPIQLYSQGSYFELYKVLSSSGGMANVIGNDLASTISFRITLTYPVT
jgi:hypothetical protein